MGLVLVSRRDI